MKKTRKECIALNCRTSGIVTRPYADDGLWLSVLLTLSLTVNVWNRDPQQVELAYKQTAILSFGLFIHSFCIFLSLCRQIPTCVIGKCVYTTFTIVVTCTIFRVCLKDNAIISIISSFGIVLYDRIYHKVLKEMPKSFTLGEATIVCQGIVLFLYNTFLNVPRIFIDIEISNDTTYIPHPVLQIILMGIGIIIMLCYLIPLFRISFCFWLLSLIVIIGTALFPIFGEPTALILFKFVFSDAQRITLVALYVALLVVSSFFVVWQMDRRSSVNTASRKVFHVLVLFVYIPGLWFQCNLLYLATGLMLALLILLETARIIRLRPIHEALESAVRCFVDEKDAGCIALTPIYLLVGCSLPIWLHPVPCDLTDSAGRNLIKLLAGILSVGIGDTMASVCGYYFGKHKWQGSRKSVEGTVASAVSQFGLLFVIFKLGSVYFSTLKAATAGSAIIINALVEAKTTQVDNLVLPLVTYIILSTV
ncbi:dolichol kinase [Topomyia yanbarensis]|uniref:dolichol kinase n=1 Tax=Topomyia yanbarensis TaxID=2498891 RepID=UPI00273B4AF5|nr:dolichol kinase [Topomyia yanbarensis]